uniref:Hemolymph proteinase 6 n=1 Tax=Antheraea pernyi TaxID=7119 RepID=A0A191XQK8_ANTPE|nr:hemolymph proteinase 6 [Antheraea pernyi]
MWLKTFIIFNLISHSIIAEDVGEICRPNNDIPEGICKLISECPEAISQIRENRLHSFERCGFNYREEIVCCPDTGSGTNDRFGQTETPTITKRIHERECEKIKEDSIGKVGLYIINGEEAQEGEFPYMVALGYDRGNEYEFDCGGSLISKNFVLSAAHCVVTLEDTPPSIVRAGVINIGGNTWNGETDYRIVEIIMPPNRTSGEKYHDLVLLKLDRDIKITDNLYPLCIETGDLAPRAPLTITGWGKISTDRSIRSNILLKANLIPLPVHECRKFYPIRKNLPRGISDEQICAADPEGLRDTCQGDSGGPLALASGDNLYRLVGVTSFGRGCGATIPGVYTRIASYIDWIESVVWPN